MPQTIQCVHCGKRFNKRMRHCPHCGGEHKKKITVQEARCPRCNYPLEIHRYAETELDICPKCSGLWLDTDEFNRLTLERNVYADETIPYEYSRKPLPQEKEYLPCVRCGSLMFRKNFKRISGVLIDVCGDHGIWLDAGELEQIRLFIANGGLEKYRDRQIMRNKEEIESLARRLKHVEFTQKVLHFWNIKYWLFKNI